MNTIHIDDLKIDENGYRLLSHEGESYEDVVEYHGMGLSKFARRLNLYGWSYLHPIVINQDNVVKDGNMRIAILKQMAQAMSASDLSNYRWFSLSGLKHITDAPLILNVPYIRVNESSSKDRFDLIQYQARHLQGGISSNGHIWDIQSRQKFLYDSAVMVGDFDTLSFLISYTPKVLWSYAITHVISSSLYSHDVDHAVLYNDIALQCLQEGFKAHDINEKLNHLFDDPYKMTTLEGLQDFNLVEMDLGNFFEFLNYCKIHSVPA